MTENSTSNRQADKSQCPSCVATALNLDEGKCEKCGATATMDEYGFKITRMRDGSYLLTDSEANPIDTISNLASDTAKQKTAKLTSTPYIVVAKTFAKLKQQQETAESQEKTEKATQEPEKAKQVFDAETEAKISAEVDRVVNADNQLEALAPHLDNMIVGEDNTKRAVAVLNLSAKCKQSELKQIILFKATEGAGKSTLMRNTTRGYNIKDVGRFSAHALDYTDLEGFEILSLKELGAMDDETNGVSTLKFLSSDDNGYTVEVTIRDEETGRFTTEQRRIPPITTVSSTTRLQLDPQFERRAWLFGLDETPEQTKRIGNWIAKNQHQKDGKILGKRKLTDEEFSCEVYRRFIEKFQPKQIIIPFPQTIVNTLSFDVLRVRGDVGKLLTFAKLYAMLNLKRLEKVTDDIYTLTPDVAVEALTLALHPISGMLAKIDDRVKALLSALKEIDDACEKGTEITKAIREKIVAKTGKSERMIRAFFGQLAASGYVSDDGKKPKTYTLLYDVEYIERKMAGILEKTESADCLMEDMRIEAQEWVKTGLENFSSLDRSSATESIDQAFAMGKMQGSSVCNKEPSIVTPTDVPESFAVVDAVVPESGSVCMEDPPTGKKISNSNSGVSNASLTEIPSNNWRNPKHPINQPVFLFEKIPTSEKCDCGSFASEYKITTPQGDVIYRCQSCYQHMRSMFTKAEWKEAGRRHSLA